MFCIVCRILKKAKPAAPEVNQGLGNARNKNEHPEAADLDLVAGILRARGITTQRFEKVVTKKGMTPDFRLLKGDELVAFGEVKSPHDDSLDREIARYPTAIVGGVKPDPIFNRLSTFVVKAAKQFNAVNVEKSVPNVLFFVNHDELSNYSDVREVLTGFFHADDGTRYRLIPRVSGGRVNEEKQHIHAVAWIDAKSGEIQGWVLNEADAENLARVCSLFGLDPDAME